jgi:hypothetical protein
MGKYVLQIPDEEGIVYIYDVETHLLYKLCEIKQSYELPENVKATLEKAGLPLNIKGYRDGSGDDYSNNRELHHSVRGDIF